MAKLFFRYAVMNAGKSTQLLQIAYDYEKNGRHILCIKPKIDTKEGSYIISRLEDGMIKRKTDFLSLPDKGWMFKNHQAEKRGSHCSREAHFNPDD